MVTKYMSMRNALDRLEELTVRWDDATILGENPDKSIRINETTIEAIKVVCKALEARQLR